MPSLYWIRAQSIVLEHFVSVSLHTLACSFPDDPQPSLHVMCYWSTGGDQYTWPRLQLISGRAGLGLCNLIGQAGKIQLYRQNSRTCFALSGVVTKSKFLKTHKIEPIACLWRWYISFVSCEFNSLMAWPMPYNYKLHMEIWYGSESYRHKIWANVDSVLCYNMMWIGHNELINSSPASAAYLRQWIGWALVQIMACRLFDAKPLY